MDRKHDQCFYSTVSSPQSSQALPSAVSDDNTSAMIVYGRFIAIGFAQQCLTLTAVFWDPQSWLYWVQEIGTSMGTPVYIESMMRSNTKGYCLDYAAVKDAVSAPPTDVSGWYGPGAFLAWLLTTYIYCVSAIWRAKKADRLSRVATVEVELLAAVMYPAVAILDISYRLIRCKVDPTLNAAMIVVFNSTITLGVSWRLCWQLQREDTWFEFDRDYFPAGLQGWMVSVFRILCHALIIGTIGEPWSDRSLVITVYVLALLNLLYSEIVTETKMDVHPYTVEAARPRLERIGVFVGIQILFVIVLGATRHTIFPQSGASLADLDQCATLATVIVATVFSKRARFRNIRTPVAGFRTVPGTSVLP
jgi:hypothetical protein